MRFLAALLGLTFTSVVAITSANAADIYGPGGFKDAYAAAPIWSGFYIGVDGGWARDPLTVTDIDGFAGAPAGNKTVFNPSGALGGGTLGYNLQRGGFVFGPEADLGYMDDSGTQHLNGTATATRVGIDGGFYGDVTGRLGYSFNRALIYAKGGFAFYDGSDIFNTNYAKFSNASQTGTFTGYTVGGGVEYKITPAWSVKGEYLYFDFGSQDFSVNTTAGTDTIREDVTVHTVKAGINYTFVPAYEPLK